MRAFLQHWNKQEMRETGDKTALDVMRREIVDLQYRKNEVDHAATYAWVLSLPHSVSEMVKAWTKTW